MNNISNSIINLYKIVTGIEGNISFKEIEDKYSKIELEAGGVKSQSFQKWYEINFPGGVIK